MKIWIARPGDTLPAAARRLGLPAEELARLNQLEDPVRLTGGLALVGVIVTVWASNSKLQHKIELSQAVTDTKLEELTREVRLHNNFAQRVPVMEEQLKVANHRISDLESKVEK